SRGHRTFLEVLEAVRPRAPRADAASFGIAGPVRDGVCVATNLPWRVDAKELAGALGLPRAGLLNDVEASAWGLEAAAREGPRVLLPGAPRPGPRAYLAAGTGLGEAGLHYDGRRHRPFACEGGHASFAPTDALGVELLRRLMARHGHVSWERVLS